MTSSLYLLRQSTSEILASAILELFPGSQLVESRVTEFGFFYDVVAEQPIDDHSLILLEEFMRGLIKKNLNFSYMEMMRENAAHYLEHRGQWIKGGAVRRDPHNIVSLIKLGDFVNYSPFSHIVNTQEVGAFKLLSIEKATHYIPDEGEIIVKRISGTVFFDKEALKKFVKIRTLSLKKENAASLSKRLALSLKDDAISDYAAIDLTDGVILKDILTNWWKSEHLKLNFELINSPSLVKESLILDSGVLDFVDTDFPLPVCEIQGDSYVISPSISPIHASIFQLKKYNLTQLPVRMAECKEVISALKINDLRGVKYLDLVHADRAHIFCDFEHLEQELISSLQFIDKIIKLFDFKHYWSFVEYRDDRLTAKGYKSKVNSKVEAYFLEAFGKLNISYVASEAEGILCGPFAEVILMDNLGREWKGPKIEVNLTLPQHLKLSYRGVNNNPSQPLMLVRSVFGSIERFTALILEQYSGLLPFWLSPQQIVVVPAKEDQTKRAQQVFEFFQEAGYRVRLDSRKESYEARKQNIPYIVVVGYTEDMHKEDMYKEDMFNGNKISINDQVNVRSSVSESCPQTMTLEEALLFFSKQASLKNLAHT